MLDTDTSSNQQHLGQVDGSDLIIHAGELFFSGKGTFTVLTTWVSRPGNARSIQKAWEAAGAVWSHVFRTRNASPLGGKYRVVAHFRKA